MRKKLSETSCATCIHKLSQTQFSPQPPIDWLQCITMLGEHFSEAWCLFVENFLLFFPRKTDMPVKIWLPLRAGFLLDVTVSTFRTLPCQLVPCPRMLKLAARSDSPWKPKAWARRLIVSIWS